MNCTNCGKPLDPGDEFCVHCGSAVMAEPGPEPTRRPPQQPPGKTGGFFSSPGGITLIVVIALIVVGGIITGVVLGTRGGDDEGIEVQEKTQEDSIYKPTQPTTEPGEQTQPVTPPEQPAGNQTPEACQAAMLEFARQSAKTGPALVDPNSVRIEDFEMLSPTHGVAGAHGSDEYGETIMGALHAEYQNGTWVCRWEQNG